MIEAVIAYSRSHYRFVGTAGSDHLRARIRGAISKNVRKRKLGDRRFDRRNRISAKFQKTQITTRSPKYRRMLTTTDATNTFSTVSATDLRTISTHPDPDGVNGTDDDLRPAARTEFTARTDDFDDPS